MINLVQEQHFSQGLRVLVIDDNVASLRSLTNELQNCGYQVTTTTKAIKALDMLRKNKDAYHIVITDAITSDMDGFKLLEIIGLEMDIPVIMTSENSDVKIIEKGIKHGARDYLVKPVGIEILRNIWQHVIRKTIYDPRPAEKIVADRRSTRDVVLYQRNQRRKDREATQSHNEEPLVRKTRVSWTPELHAKFVAAVQQLREGAAVPKKILELMKEPHLTREQVASHLQKYRASLKQKERIRQQSKNRLDASRTTHASREPNNKSFESQGPLLLHPNHHPDLFLQQQNPVLPSEDVNQVLQTMTIPTLTPTPMLTTDPHCQSDFNAIEYQPIQYQRNGITRPLNVILPYPCASGALINHVDTSSLMSGDYTGKIAIFSQPDSITRLLLPSPLPGNHEPRNLATFSGKGGSDFKENRATGPLLEMQGQVDGSTENEHIDYAQLFLLDNSDTEIHGGYQKESAPYDDLCAIFSEDPAPTL